jgi:hypothetical protein
MGEWGWGWDNGERRPWLLDPSGPFVGTADWADQQRATLRAAGQEPGTCDVGDGYLDDYLAVFGIDGYQILRLEHGRGAIQVNDDGCMGTRAAERSAIGRWRPTLPTTPSSTGTETTTPSAPGISNGLSNGRRKQR